jgi:hypothetical protein
VEPAWASSDPSVLSVQSGGILSANRAGRAWITATYRDWLRDSIEVRVEDSGLSGQDVLFRADFSDPDLPDWEVYADPLPSVLEQDGDWVLSLNGDGQYQDGLRTRSAFSLSQGATLEAEFRLPLRRTDREHVHVCLSEEDPESIDSRGIPISRATEFCLGYPSHEQLKFRADLARVAASPLSPPQEFSVAPALPSDDWVHVALQARADGTTSVFLNRQLAFKPTGRLNLQSGGNWSIRIQGASVGTDLWIRNLTLWRGERFDANALPPPTSELQGVSPVGEPGDPGPGRSP